MFLVSVRSACLREAAHPCPHEAIARNSGDHCELKASSRRLIEPAGAHRCAHGSGSSCNPVREPFPMARLFPLQAPARKRAHIYTSIAFLVMSASDS